MQLHEVYGRAVELRFADLFKACFAEQLPVEEVFGADIRPQVLNALCAEVCDNVIQHLLRHAEAHAVGVHRRTLEGQIAFIGITPRAVTETV